MAEQAHTGGVAAENVALLSIASICIYRACACNTYVHILPKKSIGKAKRMDRKEERGGGEVANPCLLFL